VRHSIISTLLVAIYLFPLQQGVLFPLRSHMKRLLGPTIAPFPSRFPSLTTPPLPYSPSRSFTIPSTSLFHRLLSPLPSTFLSTLYPPSLSPPFFLFAPTAPLIFCPPDYFVFSRSTGEPISAGRFLVKFFPPDVLSPLFSFLVIRGFLNEKSREATQ